MYLGLVDPNYDPNLTSAFQEGAGIATSFESGNIASGLAQTGELGVNALVMTGLLSTGVGAPLAAAFAAGEALLSSIHLRAGANEADAITPTQNAIGNRLTAINASIATASVPQLQAWINELMMTARQFRAFVMDPRFTDGRASQQALNTIMPLIDGTDASGFPCQTNKWGNPCNGGTIGSIQRQLLSMGVPIGAPQLTQGASMGPYLQTPIPGSAYLPQSGYIPPTSPLSSVQNAGIITVPAASDSTGMVLAGVAALLFIGLGAGRKKRR